MVMGKLKGRAHFRVALETSGRRFSRVHDCAPLPAALNVQAARAVTRLAANVLRVVALRLQAGVRRRRKIAGDRFVAGGAFFRADKLRSRNAGWRNDRTARFKAAAGK